MASPVPRPSRPASRGSLISRSTVGRMSTERNRAYEFCGLSPAPANTIGMRWIVFWRAAVVAATP